MTSERNEPKVSIFGNTVESDTWNAQTSDRIIWGFFLIFAGVIFMLNTQNVLPWDIWREVAGFWPLLVIFAGLQIVLGSNFLARIILGTLAFLSFSIVLLTILQNPFPEFFASLPAWVQNIIEIASSLGRKP